MKKLSTLLIVCCLTVVFCETAHAVQIKRIQRGISNFDIDDVAQEATLANTVDQTKSIILLSAIGDTQSSNDQNWYFTADFADADSISIDRGGGTSPASVAWQVIEFDSGVTVQRGISVLNSSAKSKTITITSVDTSKAVPFVMTRGAYNSATRTDELASLKPTFASATSLQLDRSDSGSGKVVSIVWQVVEFTSDASVQTGTIKLDGNAAATPQSNTATVTSVAAPLLVTYFNGETTGDTALNGQDTRIFTACTYANTTVTCTRRDSPGGTATQDIQARFYLVDLADGHSLTQTNTQTWAAGGTTRTIANPGIATSGTNYARMRVTTTVNHGYADGDYVFIGGDVTAASLAMGGWKILTGASCNDTAGVCGAAQFELVGSTYVAAATAGTVMQMTKMANLGSDIDTSRAWVWQSTRANSGTSTTTTYADDLAVAMHLDDSNSVWSLRGSRSTAIGSVTEYGVTEFAPVTLTVPNGGESWAVGSLQTISWKSAASVATHDWKLQYSTGPTTKNIVSSTNATPISVQATAHGLTTGDTVVIAGHVTNTNANGTWRVTVTDANNFTLNNSVGNGVGGATGTVTYYAYTDMGSVCGGGGASACTGTDLSTNTATYKVQDYISTQFRVRLVDTTGTQAGPEPEYRRRDDSNADLTVKRSLTLTSPNGGEAWVVNSSHEITWDYTGSTNWGTVALKYSTDGGGTFPNTIATGEALGGAGSDTPPFSGKGTYTWTVPDSIDTDIRVEVSSETDTAIKDSSDANFSIIRSITLTAPTAASLVAQTAWNITWTYKGETNWGTVKLQYSTDAPHAVWTDIATGVSVGTGGPANGSGSYSATNIPAITSSTLKVRVISESDAAVSSTSAADSTVVAKITVDQPSGGTFYVDQNDANSKIMWTLSSALASGFVKITYSTDNGSSYPNVIAASTQSDNTDATHGFKTWTIPDDVRTTAVVKVKVEDTANSSVYGESPSAFKILGQIDVLTPGGGEVYNYGANVGISWTMHGTYATDKFNIYLSSNGGTTYPTLLQQTLTAPAGNNSWTWPTGTQAAATNYRIKVTLNSDEGNVFVNSTSNFRLKPVLDLTAPNGGEVWAIGSSQNITWTKSGSTDSVDLTYSTNSGGAYGNSIASAYAGASSYPWTLPDAALSTTLRVKAALNGDATVYDTSANDFKGKGALAITVPSAGGVVWEVGTTQNITWTSTPLAQGNVKLFYSTDGGSTYPDPANLITTQASSDQSYTWTIPDAIGTNVKVKIVGVNDATVNDESDNAFKIKAKFVLSRPNGGESFLVGANEAINWSTAGTVSAVNLYRSSNSGGAWTSITTALSNTNTYSWGSSGGVADSIGTTNRIKVEDASDSTASDSSNADYTILGSLDVTAPDGAETLVVGGSKLITWTAAGTLGSVKIFYSTDGGSTYPDPANLIATVPASNLNYNWTPIPDAIGANVKIKIVEQSAPQKALDNASGAAFAIKGSITLTAPNNGENFFVGQHHNITWTKTGTIGNIKLVYSTDSGATYPEPDNVIASGVDSAAGTYDWTVADAIVTTARVKAYQESDSSVGDTSNNDFNIKGSLTLTSFTGGQSVEVGSNQSITWTRNGNSMGPIKIEYSTDGGTSYPNTITASVASAALSQAWTIPDAIGTQVRVKLTLLADAATSSASSSNFEIKGKLTVTAPNGNETWLVGTPHNITWTTAGTIPNVNIHYSTDSGATYPTKIAGPIPNSSPYNWTIPDAIGVAARVRVSNVDDANVKDESNSDFTIKGILGMTYPDGGEVWVVGSSQIITWTRTGSLGNVSLKYSTDGGSSYPTTIATVPASDLTYDWTIPDDISATARVKITETSNPIKADAVESAANFAIKGSFTITSPNGGQVWAVGSSHAITWTKTGTLANAKILFSSDGGSNYVEPDDVIIASVAASDLTYTWTLPDTATTTARVKIVSLNDALVNDASNANFTIQGSLTLTAPTGGQTWVVGESKQITWTHTGTLGNCTITYGTDSGVSYPNTLTANVSGSADSYNWTIPDNISNTVRVKIEQNSNPAVKSESSSDLSIKGGFTVTAPNGSESWLVGSSHNITWTTAGTVANVKLFYSADSGTNWTAITGSIANSSPYSWTIPDAIGSALRVKVENAADSSVKDISNADFAVKGVLALTSPAGTETWIVGSQHLITWTKTGSLGNVDIDYSTDGGSTYPNSIAAGVPASDLNFNWTIPDSISATARVKVTEVSVPAKADAVESAADFAIKGSLTITSPNGSEVWLVGSSHNVTWTKTGTLGNIKLVYSTDAGTNYTEPDNVISAGVAASDGTFPWTVPDTVGTQIRVKATLLADTGVNDASNANFIIRGSLTLTSMTGGQAVVVGDSQAITWTYTGTIGNIKIDYSTNSGSSYPNSITASVAATALSQAWTIPNDISDTVRVKLTQLSDAQVVSASTTDLAIKGGLTITSPNGNETWLVGSSHNITWNTAGTVPNIKLYYSTDGGGTFPNAITGSIANSSPYSWTIPDAIDTDIRVKIENAADASVTDSSNANFAIKGDLALTAPTGGQTWIVGGSQLITWTKTGSLGDVKIFYSTDGGSTFPDPGNLIATVPASDLNYSWTIPDSISDTVRVKLTEVGGKAADASSGSDLAIKGSLTITAPNGSDVLKVGDTQAVTWTKTGTLGNIKLLYSTDGGSTYPDPANVITASVAATAGTFDWTVPDDASEQVLVKAVLLSDTGVNDASNSVLAIRPSVTLTSPNTNVSWNVGSAHNITWTKTGTVATVKLEYTTDGGNNYTLITGSVAGGALSYGWTVPDAVSDTIKVKITSNDDASVTDSSDVNFAVKPTVTLTAPNGGEAWVVNSAYDITWTKVGTIVNVKLTYSTDGGSTYPNTIINSTNAADLTYEWTIPDDIDNQVKVKVAKVGDEANVFDESDANFKIKGALQVTSPNGTESWGINTHHNITWNTTGTVGTMKIEYSTDAGSTFPNVITASVDSALGTYDWLIPDDPTSQGKVKITSTLDSTVTDASNSNFSMVGTLFLASPDGGEAWIVGSSHNITWTKFGSIATVKLEYSTDGGTTYPNSIATGVSAAGLSYTWTIPDAIDTDIRVKITDEGNASVNDFSAANFTIKGSVTVTSPNGSETWKVGESRNLTWTKTGSIGNVKIDYSTNGGGAYPNAIVASVPGDDLSYAWTVADAIGIQLRVKVTTLADATVYDASNNDFTVRGQLTVTAPNGAETWIVGAVENITWSRVGSIANAKLEYSTDGGTTFPNEIIASTGAAAGTYAWTIPDSISGQVRVRVSDASDAAVKDDSDANLAIKGSLTITAPNGGQSWVVGSVHAITWTKTGTFANVKLEYSTDGGSNYPNEITASTSATAGTFDWTIPDSIGATVKVKVTNLSDGAVADASNTNFSIIGSLTLTAPNGSELWYVGDSNNITWTKVGSIANVKLEYSKNGGSTYPNQITASTPAGALSYSWTIPDQINQTVRVRISDATDANVADTSDANFTIAPLLTLTAPNGGEVWVVNDSQDITWTKTGSEGFVKLEYSTDGGSTFPNSISASTANTGSYSWTVPDQISTTVSVRLTAVSNAAAFDTSDINFKIRGSLTLTAPNGNESWDVAAHNNVTWTKVGSIALVKLEYSTNGGGAYPNLIAAGLTASDGTYDWTIPDAISTTLRVKVTDSSDGSVYDTSNANFTIKGAFTLTAPNGGEGWVVGTGHNITWTRFGSILTADLAYSTNGGSSYPNAIVAGTDASTGTYSWTIPDAIGSSVRVKITDGTNANVSDASNANFTIQGAFTLNSPNGGEVWIVGSAHNITWSRTGSILNAKLDYSTDSGATFPNSIIGVTDATTGSYSWSVPDAIGGALRVRITDTTNANVKDDSDGDFTVKGSLEISAPNGGETWIVGASQNITWNRSGTIPTVKLEYSTNGGSTFPNSITASTNGTTGSYAWTIPDAIGTSLRVRVTDTSDASVVDETDANFTVKGSVTVTSPNGSEAWVVNSSHNVTWTKTGTFANVKIEYSTDSGSTYPNTIQASVNAANGTYAWSIPDDIQSSVRVKVTNLSDGTVADASDTNFKIVGAFTVTAPNGAELWQVGSNQDVTWTKIGSIQNAKIEYSTNSGSTYPNTIVASTSAAALSYTWVVPDNLNTTARVRVSDASDSSVNDTSDANFQIVAGFHITAPDGGEVWTVASAQDITWTKVGSATNVKLEYSTDGGTNFSNTISASTSNSGTYAWTVPDAIGSNLKVKVSDAANANASDASDLNFRVRGALTLTAPNGNEVWNVSTSNNITWTRTGSIASVKLEYSIDDGATYPNLINGNVDASLLTYAWTIPDDLTANARVKVTDASDGTVTDSSNAKFRIAGTLTLTAPNGGETWLVGSAYNITWTKVGSIATVKLEYSTDGGASYPNEIIPSVQATDLSYSWTIPDAISTQMRVKITDTSFAGSNDITNANFKIAGVLAITSPVGGEVWDVASVHAITWTRQGSISNVKLEYSTNGGSTYPNSITNSTSAAAASYNWTVPDSIGTQLRVKITNLSDNTVNDTSDSNFKIAGVLTLTAPNGGEVWNVGSSQAIAWTRVGSIANAKLTYSTDGGVNYDTTIIASIAANTLGYSWTIPDSVSSTVKAKIEDASDDTVFDASDANFKIRGSFTLTSPNGSEGWVIGTTHAVTWTKTGTIANAKLEYSKDSGANYTGTIVGSTPAANLTYNWSIPDDVGTQIRVKISQVGDATVFDVSDANFTIRGGFTITSPVGGEAWAVGSTHDITWTTGGTIPNVKLQLSTNGGASYTSTIIASTTNTNSYTWSVPDALTLQARVSVQDVNDAQAIDASPANFKIQGTFTITSPNGGDALQVGASKSITWTKTGSISNAKLEYSTNSGSTYPNLIIASTSASALTYSWTVPDAIGTTLKIKITDVADNTVLDTSDGDFSIKGTFTVTAPNGSEAWTVASTQNITWGTLGTVANVKLEYSTDAGSTFTVVTASTANAGTYAWTVPDAITTQLRVRVSDTTDSSAFDVSDANAKIKGSLTITAPNGGEKWNVGTARLITWDRVGSVPNVKLEYSSNNGAVYVPIIASTGNTGAYSWTIPDSIGTQALVRVTDTGDNTVVDVSNAVFKIMGNFTMTSPNGGEVWSIASSQNLTWTSSGTMTFAKLEYSTDGGSNYNLIVGSTANNGLYAWTVPDAVTGSAKIRVSDPNDADAFDESNANFRMRVVLVITAPNGGQKWTVGRASTITWNSTGTIANVKLMYSNDGFVGDSHVITAATANNGSYSWTLPDAISNTVRVRISDPNDIGALDDSNADFKIMGGFVVTSPNGTEKWDVDSIHSITWTHTGSVTDAKIEISTNGGAAYSAVAQTTNTDSYDWAVPDTISASCRIKISDPLDSDAFDVSDANFKIRAKFTVSAPNGGEIWTVNDANNIVWATVGTVPNVKLDYSTDSGSTYPNSIILTTANAGTYSWTVPDSISTLVRVRVMSVTDVDAFDASNADFKIRGKFVVSAPNGAEQWKIAQSNNITWATTGTIANVKLYYSTNSGSTYPNVINASVANTNTYAWTVPDAPTTNARVRVENVTDSTVYDDSNANFSIQGFFTLTSPNGGEAWEVAQVHNITWNWGGTIANVKLTYSTDSGATYPHVISASSANGAGSSGSHSYSWTIPDDISPTVRVKVEDPNDAAVFDDSDADLKIIAKFVITAPNGGERWVTNETRNITWTTAGTVPSVKLVYSHDNFATNTVITASTNNANTYAWTIPDPGLANVPKTSKVRVLDVNDPAVYDSSDASFNIDYYLTTWDVRDLLTNAALSGLTATGVQSTNQSNVVWSEAGISANPPRQQPMPFGVWVVTWSKSGYGDVAVTVISDRDNLYTTANGNPVLMETSTVHIWLADSRITYDPNTKILDAPAWLSRDGSVVTGAVDVTMKIYEGSSVIATLSDNQVDASGFFHLSFDNSGDLLVAGKTYTTITDISNAAGGHFKSPGSFEITTPSKLQEVLDTVNTVLDKPMSIVSAELNATLAAQTNTLTTTLDAQTTTINTKLDSQTATINTKLDQQTAIIQATLTSFENTIQSAIDDLNTAAQSSLNSAEVLRDTALKFSWQATVSPNPAQYGEKVTIQAQGPANLSVMLQVYNDANEEIVNEELRDTPEQPGVYIYEIESTRLTKIPGKSYSGVVSESTTGGLASFSGSTTGTTLDAVLGVASQASEASKNAKDAVAAIKELQASMATGGDVRGALRNLQAAVNNLPAEVAKISGGQTKGIRTVVNDIQERLTRLAGNEGLDLSQIVGGAIEESATIQSMSQQTEKIQVATNMVSRVVEQRLGGADKIIVADFLESNG